jgi:hypothetical protein
MPRASSIALVLWPAALAAWLCGCPGQGAAPSSAAGTAESRRTAVAAVSADPKAAAPELQLPAGLVVAAEPAADGVVPVIQNRSDRMVEIALEASVEAVPTAETARAASVEPLRLDCAKDAPRCVSLVPGAELRPSAWPAAQARAQCGASARGAAAVGRYRFSVRACGAAPTALARSSEPFTVP